MTPVPVPRSREDWLPPAALAGFAVVDVLTADGRGVHGPRGVLLLVATAAAAALLWRRHAPLTVVLVVAALFVGPSLVWGSSQLVSGVLVLVVGIFAAGRYGRRPRAYAAVPLGCAVTLALTALDPQQPAEATWVWSLNTVWIFALGAWLRQKQQLVEAAAAEAAERARSRAAEQRVHVAQELHDVLAHSLTLMVVQAEAADAVLDDAPAAARRALGDISASGRTALAQVRRVLTLLDTPLDAVPQQRQAPEPASSVADLVAAMRAAGLPVTLDLHGDVDVVPDRQRRVIERVVQESLTNVLRHAGAVRTHVRVAVRDGSVAVCVENAPGRPATQLVGSGRGLAHLRSRVEEVGGCVHATPDDGGHRVSVELPLPVGRPV